MAKKKHLIIGAGPAALSALKEIRRITSEDEVKLVSKEDYPSYSPAALCSLLSGRITEAELWMRDENYFTNLRGTFVRGKEVTQVLPQKKKVIYHDGSSEGYDTLLIASGAEPAKPPIQGLQEVGAQDFRTLSDCRLLLQKLRGKKNVAILGAGLVGMKVAVALLERGCQVSVIEKEQNILPLCFNEEAEAYIRETLMERNVRFFMSKEVTSVKRKAREVKIALSDNSSLDADILVNATGVKSRLSLLRGTGVKTNSGILVDKRMRTNVDQIYAAGDVAEAPDFFSSKSKMNACIPGAISQGRVAGANMAGLDAEYEGGIPITALGFLGNHAFSIGLSFLQNNRGQVLKQKDDSKKRFKKLVYSGDRLLGGMFVNENVDPGIILYLIKKRVDISPYREALFEGTRPLSDPWLSSLKFRPVVQWPK